MHELEITGLIIAGYFTIILLLALYTFYIQDWWRNKMHEYNVKKKKKSNMKFKSKEVITKNGSS